MKNFVDELVDRGYLVTILLPNLDPEDRRKLKGLSQSRLRVIAVSSFKTTSLERSIVLRFLVGTLCYFPLTIKGLLLKDIYCTVSFYHPTHLASLAAQTISKVNRRPHIIWVRDLFPYSDDRKLTLMLLPRLLVYKIARIPFPAASLVIFISAEIQSLAISRHLILPEKCRILPNMVDVVKRIGENRNINLHIPPTAQVVAYVGEVYAHRLASLIIVLKAMRILVDEGYPIRLLLLGYGDGLLEFDKVATRLNLNDNIIMTGKVSHELIPHYLRRAHIAIGALTSSVEVVGSVPQKILEYMVASLPIINASNAVSNKLVADGVNGLLITPDNEKDLAEAVKRIIKDEPLRIRLGNNSRFIVVRDYSVNAVMDRFEGLLEELE